jgi:hypothetical protein
MRHPLLNTSTTLFLLPSIFVDASDNLLMVDDVATPSNPPVATVDKEELEKTTLNETPLDKVAFNETPFDKVALDETPLDEMTLEVNVSQWSREEEPFRRMVRTRVNRSALDRRLSPNPHALAIYLEFVLARKVRTKKVQKVPM